jgi:hypothetical protein
VTATGLSLAVHDTANPEIGAISALHKPLPSAINIPAIPGCSGICGFL